MAFRRGAKLSKKPPAARLVDPVLPPPRGRQEPQRFMVNVLLRRTILGLESHPDRVGSPDDDRPRFPAMAGNCAFERTRRRPDAQAARRPVAAGAPLARGCFSPEPGRAGAGHHRLASDQPQIAAPIYALS